MQVVQLMFCLQSRTLLYF